MVRRIGFAAVAASAAIAAAVAVFVLPATAGAERVGPDDAERLARRFVESRDEWRGRSAKTGVRLRHTARRRAPTDGLGLAKPAAASGGGQRDDALLYVFNVGAGADSGFVIVAGDDAARPVLGYSDNGGYDEYSAPPNFAYWMDCLERQIEYAAENTAERSEAVGQEWENYLSGNVPMTSSAGSSAAAAVSPLIQTKWNQTAPYNGMCPTVNYPGAGGTRTATGCVATAMAQIMKYHRYTQDYTFTRAYTTSSRKFDMPSELAGNYDWNSMLNTYTATSGTAAQKDAVAKLIYHAGLSVEMDYDTSGSGAYSIDVPRALTEYFGYDRSVQRKERDACDDATWENILTEQLNAGLPVYYSGAGGDIAKAGHAFICDGYDAAGRFHFNWGWGGTYDGYFVTTALAPGTGGTGAGGGVYNNGQEIIINIMPDIGGAASSCEFALRDKFTVTETSITPKETFVVECGVKNTGWREPPGAVSLGAALTDGSGRIVEVVGKTTIRSYRINGGFFTSPSQNRISSCRITNNVSAGAYKLRMVFSVDSGTHWTPIEHSYAGVPNGINVQVTTVNAAAPVITVQPEGATVDAGETYTLRVEAAAPDGGALSYQWYAGSSAASDGKAIPGATDAVCAVSASAVGTYYYYAVVTSAISDNGDGGKKTISQKSGVVSLKVNPVPPTITAQPADQTVVSGGAVKFSVEAKPNGAGALTYRWQVNTSAGATPAPRSITVLMRDETGDGWNSASLRISVNGVDRPANPTISGVGQTATYTFSAEQGDAVAFYWNAGSYNRECAFAVYYTDAPPSPAFDPASAAVNDAGTLLLYRQYGGLISVAGGALLGSFIVDATTAADFFSNVSGGTAATCTIPAATPAMSGYRYRCVVSNDYGQSDTSEYAEVTVNTIAVMSRERTIPKPLYNGESAMTAPVTAPAAEFTAGPNPATRRGAVSFFYTGKPVADCELRVYDALGNMLRRINLRDREAAGNVLRSNQPRRLAGAWDLRDAKGRPVSAGVYLVKGALTAHDGKKEAFAIFVEVR